MSNRRRKKDSFFIKTLKNMLVILSAFILAFYVGFKMYIASLPPIQHLESFTPNVVTKIYSSDQEIIKTFTAYKFEEVDLDKVPKYLKEALIATEDKNFYTHEGYDLFGLLRSIVANIKAGRCVQGASTITQQLARILFLSNEKTFDRKIKEFIVSAQIEKTLTKDQILEMYLNNVYLGSGAYGVAAAAQIYFDKSLTELNLAEAALIAGLPQAPSRYSPFNNFDLAQKRKEHVLKRMYRMHYITKDEYYNALETKIKLNSNPSIYSFNKAPYFVDRVMEELDELGFDETEISQSGYKIITTLDYKAQKRAQESIKANLAKWGLTSKQQQAAAFAISPDNGAILVYVGGKNYANSQYDRISQAIRPPGSAFKPFVYATAIQYGYSPTDIIPDTPFRIADWSPRNYGNRYRGNLPLYAGLTYSSNVMAARLIKDVGIRSVINICRSVGITTPLENDYTISLGSNGVKLSEMVIAYGAFANGGYKVKPYSIERIETSRGNIIYEAPKARIIKAISTDTASSLTVMLKTVIEKGTGRAANIGKPAAAKTGTTDNYKDAWFIGYTPNVVCGIWVGKDDNTVMSKSLTGGTVPALIWKDTMIVATEKFGNVDFSYEPIDLVHTKPSEKVKHSFSDEKEQVDEVMIDETEDNINLKDTNNNIDDSNINRSTPVRESSQDDKIGSKSNIKSGLTKRPQGTSSYQENNYTEHKQTQSSVAAPPPPRPNPHSAYSSSQSYDE